MCQTLRKDDCKAEVATRLGIAVAARTLQVASFKEQLQLKAASEVAPRNLGPHTQARPSPPQEMRVAAHRAVVEVAEGTDAPTRALTTSCRNEHVMASPTLTRGLSSVPCSVLQSCGHTEDHAILIQRNAQ